MNFKTSTLSKSNASMSPSRQRAGLLFIAIKALNSQAQCSSAVLQTHYVCSIYLGSSSTVFLWDLSSGSDRDRGRAWTPQHGVPLIKADVVMPTAGHSTCQHQIPTLSPWCSTIPQGDQPIVCGKADYMRPHSSKGGDSSYLKLIHILSMDFAFLPVVSWPAWLFDGPQNVYFTDL